MLIVLILLVGAFVGASSALVRALRDAVAAPSTTPTPMPRRDPRLDHPSFERRPDPGLTEFGLVLVGVEVVDDAYVLDGVVTDDDCVLGPLGWPVSLRLRQVGGSWIDEAARRLLSRWITEDTSLRVELRADRRRSNVTISDGTSTFRFGPDRPHPQLGGVGP